MNPQIEKSRMCFVIGRMGGENLQRLNQLAELIIKPILDDYGYDVVIPDDPSQGRIMRQVIKRLDQADIVVADITGSNPNVFYELGIRHALGLPYVVVTEDNVVPFDIREYRFEKLDINSIIPARERIRPALEAAHQQVVDDTLPGNPVTDYYKAAMTEISPAPGLALGYYNNFIARVVRDVGEDDFDLEINQQNIPHDIKQDIPLFVVKPRTLADCEGVNIRDALIKKKIVSEAKVVPHRAARGFNLYAFKNDVNDGELALLDVPTTLTSVIQTIRQRFSGRPDFANPDWKRLEEQEIDRFFAVFTRLRDNEMRNSIKSRIRTIDWNALV